MTVVKFWLSSAIVVMLFLTAAANENNGSRTLTTTTSIKDKVAPAQIIEPKSNEILYMDEAFDDLLNSLVRYEASVTSILGEPGAGKTALLQKLADAISDADKLKSKLHQEYLKDRIILSISGRHFPKFSGDLELPSYLETIKTIVDSLGKKPILVFNETQFLKPEHFSALAEFAESNPQVAVILEQTDNEYSQAKTSVPGLQRSSVAIRVPSYSRDQVLHILDESSDLYAMEMRTSLKATPEALEAVVDTSEDYRVDLAEPARSLQLLDDLLTATSQDPKVREINKADVYRFVAKKSGVKVVPQDREAFFESIEELRARVKARVLGQDQIIDGLVDQLKSSQVSQGKKHSLAMIMGPTGVGKTYGAEVIAEEFYGNKDRVLELDMTQFQDKNQVNVLLGAPNGYISSDKSKGVLCEFLDGPGNGGSVIIMNEFEEAHSDAVTRLMELFDKGYIRCGDGQLRYLGRSLIIMTSNKNSETLLPNERVSNMDEAELDKVVGDITQDQMKSAWTDQSSYAESGDNQIKTAVVERIDKYYYAKPLLPGTAVQVMKIEVGIFANQQRRAEDIQLEVDDAFSENLLDAFYNQENGARQIKTMVQQTLSKALTEFRKQYGYDASKFLVTAELHPSRKTDSMITITDKDSGKSIQIEGPKVPVTNQLYDKDVRERLKNLEDNLKSEVFGQDESVEAIVSAAKGRFLNPDDHTSTAGFLIGTTGTGKTQLGKSTAKYLYGNEKALANFEMGKINHESDLNNILSPGKGVVGSDKPGELELFLQAYPDGGVIIFDEMSNAGGDNPGLKTAIFKQLYGMLEEGIYKTPSGKTYDLSKYLLLFTGNEGEEIFKGVSSDNMIDGAYKDATKDPQTIKNILREAGVPDAFIGRLAFVKLMRPAKSEVRKLIAKKLLKEWVEEIENSQPVVIVYDDKMVEDLAELMFSPEEGARSIKQFIKTKLSNIVGDAVLNLNWGELSQTDEKAEIQLSIQSINPTEAFYSGDKPDPTKAVLRLETRFQGKVASTDELDFTGQANFTPQSHIDDARATAAHEMGHLITSFTDFTGKKPVAISIVKERLRNLTAAGYVQYDRVETIGSGSYTYDRVVKEAAGLLAGSEAETLFTGAARNTGRSNDLQKAAEMIRKVALEYHMIPELDGAEAFTEEGKATYEDLPDDKKKVFEAFVEKVLTEARQLAVQNIRENAHLVTAGVDLLMKHGRLNAEEIERLLQRGEKVKNDAGLWKQSLVKYSFGYIKAETIYPMSTEGIVLEKDCADLLSGS